MLPQPPFSRQEAKAQRGKGTFPGHTALWCFSCFMAICAWAWRGWGWLWDPRPVSFSAAPSGLTLCPLPPGVLHPTRARSARPPLPQRDPALCL